MARFVEESLVDAFNRAVKNAKHLRVRDAPAVTAARMLAAKIDAWNVIVEWAHEDAAEHGSRPAVPANDNVSIASFLKYLEKLKLLPEETVASGSSASSTGRAPVTGIDSWMKSRSAS